MITDIEKLIGKHPENPDFFAEWLNCEDMPIAAENPNKKHRKLDAQQTERQNAIEQVALWLIKHHIRESTLYDYQQEKKKKQYNKYGFSQYLNTQKHLPTNTNTNTQKGNLGEIVFYEYLHKTTTYQNLIYKLRYSTNTDQAMKGDDVLLFNSQNLYEKVILGESKFRSEPDGTGIEEIISSFYNEYKLPESITFVAGVLRDLGKKELSIELSKLQVDLHNGKVPLLCVGFFMSNEKAHTEVENHELYGNFSITQNVIDELGKLDKPFPFDLSSLIGIKCKNFILLKEKINNQIKEYDKTQTSKFQSLANLDKNVRGFKTLIDKCKKTNQQLIDDLYSRNFPKNIDLTTLIGKKLNNEKIKTIGCNKTIDALDKGYEDIIYHYSDKTQNSKLVCLTFAIENPEIFVQEAFAKANELLIDIENLPFDYQRNFLERINEIFDFQNIRTILSETLQSIL